MARPVRHLEGSDARLYDDNACSATLAEEGFQQPDLNSGCSSEFQFCMDVPPAAIKGGQLFLQETFSLDESKVYGMIQ